MKTTLITDQSAAREFAVKLTAMKNEAMRLGMFRTMKRLDDACKECGWELAGEPTPKWQHQVTARRA